MNTHFILAASLIVGSATAAELAERYTIEPQPVSVTQVTDSGETSLIEESLFKLDSHLGTVWRMDTNGFQCIAVRDLVSQRGHTEWQEKQFFKRLDAIEIPEIDLRQESCSNAVAFLQKQVRQLDPAIAAGSDDFIRLKYAAGDYPVPLITFNVRDISALEALRIITQVTNTKYHSDDGQIVITPLYSRGGQITEKIYEVSPSLRDRLRGTTVSNVLSELGFDMHLWSHLRYSPELDIIVAGTTYWEHRELQELLVQAHLARQRPGRFRLVSRKHNGESLLFLLDGKTGQTWRYQATIFGNGLRQEHFELLQTDWCSEADN